MGLFGAIEIEDLVNFVIEEKGNFWEKNSSLKTKQFKELYDSDKTNNKSRSSKIMICILLICDEESKYYKLPEFGDESKFRIVFGEILNNENYYEENTDFCDNLFKYYELLSSTPASRYLKSIERLIEDRALFMSSQSYLGSSVEHALEIDKLMISTDKIIASYDFALLKLSKEVKTKGKGGANRSLTDKGEI